MTYKEQQTRNLYMIFLHESGMTYAQIGEKVGLSRQRVFQLIGGKVKRHSAPITREKCIYKGLRNWMLDNDVSRAEMSRRMYGNSKPVNFKHLTGMITGKLNMRKLDIDKIIKITGLTYEELFKEQRKEDEGK